MESAKSFIEKLISVRSSIGCPDQHVLTFPKSESRKHVAFLDVEHPRSRRIFYEMNGRASEVILFMTGIIIEKESAAFTKPIKPSRAKYQKQSLTITGLGSELFEKAVHRLHQLIGSLDASFPEEAVQECQQIGKTDVETSNRYLTSSNDIGHFRQMPLGADLDPNGHLSKAAIEEDLVHTEDNRIVCFQTVTEGPGHQTRVHAIAIKDLCIGDAVDIGISLVSFPVKNDRSRVFAVLRSVNLLDTRYSTMHSKLKFVRPLAPPSANDDRLHDESGATG
ncbi:hypothetical protein C8J56DRAFT_964238 [Mycena floridula]|nr:hypothetical protein C8J56DRAFT_964238 [Mycena floridula]